ncbi:hypothetical protein LZ554_002782 [Drepanopeziza brunnea f. sp. 'monogermtubi']|nr:hypothetical protein LZ554_002782 [Drepanopeziza brunnea f. sp. 'monogermtubi']
MQTGWQYHVDGDEVSVSRPIHPFIQGEKERSILCGSSHVYLEVGVRMAFRSWEILAFYVYFSHNSPHNVAALVPAGEVKKRVAVGLYAVTVALPSRRSKVHTDLAQGLELIIHCTDQLCRSVQDRGVDREEWSCGHGKCERGGQQADRGPALYS